LSWFHLLFFTFFKNQVGFKQSLCRTGIELNLAITDEKKSEPSVALTIFGDFGKKHENFSGDSVRSIPSPLINYPANLDNLWHVR
jgi:hypothetical protein